VACLASSGLLLLLFLQLPSLLTTFDTLIFDLRLPWLRGFVFGHQPVDLGARLWHAENNWCLPSFSTNFAVAPK